MQNNIQILSTKKISDSLIGGAEKNSIFIDELSLITTEEIVSSGIKKRIGELSEQKISVIFTSSKAVNAVRKFASKEILWEIFCIEPATRNLVEKYFKNIQIAGSAKNAEELSDKIIRDSSVKNIIFFCGNQRRNTLPDKLRNQKINVEEIVVYKTTEMPQLVSKTYDGILFFSPSAVRSFFSLNKIKEATALFAIGDTTAEEIKLFTKAKIIIAPIPDPKKLIDEVLTYFSTIKTL